MNLLRQLTDLVDRDVAANSKPLSLLGMIVPMLPFMLFVDGAPADRFPVLTSLAFAAGVAWALFVMWRVIRHMNGEMAKSGYEPGSAHYWKMLLGVIGAILIAALILMKFEGKL